MIDKLTNKTEITNTTYDRLKLIVTLILPGFGTMYLTLAQIWELPNGDQVAATTLALATFLGLFLRFSGKAYDENGRYDGDVLIQIDEEGNERITFDLKDDPVDIKTLEDVAFKVMPPQPMED